MSTFKSVSNPTWKKLKFESISISGVDMGGTLSARELPDLQTAVFSPTEDDLYLGNDLSIADLKKSAFKTFTGTLSYGLGTRQ